MNGQELPRPSQNYRILQQQLVKALEASSHSERNEVHRLRPLLIEEFEEAFDLKITAKFPSRRKRDARMLLASALKAEGYTWKDFDHVNQATRPGFGGEILVSQPYGVAAEVHQRLAAKFGYSFTQADEWTYYYPGKSQLFIVTVTQDAIRRLRKAYRKGWVVTA